jgi:hypothetical protein
VFFICQCNITPFTRGAVNARHQFIFDTVFSFWNIDYWTWWWVNNNLIINHGYKRGKLMCGLHLYICLYLTMQVGIGGALPPAVVTLKKRGLEFQPISSRAIVYVILNDMIYIVPATGHAPGEMPKM